MALAVKACELSPPETVMAVSRRWMLNERITVQQDTEMITPTEVRDFPFTPFSTVPTQLAWILILIHYHSLQCVKLTIIY